MSSAPASAVLFPNFGAEEGEDDSLPSGRAGRTVLAPLWSLIFDADVRLDNGGELLERPGWFSQTQPEAAFEWLRGATGLVPWLPTERAQSRAQDLGLLLWGPAPACVWQVSDKAWAHRTANELELVAGATPGWSLPLSPDVLCDEAQAVSRIEAHIRSLPPFAQGYTLKPRLGSSGRGRVIVRELPLAEPVRAAFRRLAERGGAMLEPWLSRVQDFSVQLYIGDDDFEVLATTQQLLRPSGTYEGNRGIYTEAGIRSGTPYDAALVDIGKRVAARLQELGFRGPCGIDAFSFLHEGQEILRPFVELNARFTTGTLAAGIIRRAVRAHKLRAGQRWQFGICPPHGGFEKLPGLIEILPLQVGGASLAILQAEQSLPRVSATPGA